MAKKMSDVVEEIREAVTNAFRDVAQSFKKNADDVAESIRKHMNARKDWDSSAAQSGSNRPGNTKNASTTDGSAQGGDRDQKGCGDPVDVATGAVFLQQTDLSLPGDLPLILSRKHSSDWTYGHWLGPSWSSTFDERVDIHTDLVGRSSAVVVTADARTHVFKNFTSGQDARPVAGGPFRLRFAEEGEVRLLDTATGETRHFTPDGAGGTAWLSSITNPSGDWIRFARDEHGAPTEVTHSAGYRVEVATSGDRVTGLTVTGADGSDPIPVRTFRYGDHGDLVGVLNGSGEELEFGYDQHRLTRWVDRNGTFYDYEYDAHGRCVSQGGSDGVMRNTFAYGEANASGVRETRVTDSRDLTTVFKINSRFQVVATVDPLGATTSSEWSEQNQLLARVDPLGRRTTFFYDDAGNLTRVARPDDSRATTEWIDTDGGPRPSRLVLPDGSMTTLGYDDAGRRISVTDATGATTGFAYDDHGHLASVTDPLGRVRTIETDAAGLPKSVVEADGRRVEYERDHFGRVVASTDALGARSEYGWTVEGQLAARLLPDGSTESWTYDGEGNPVSYTDPAGRVTMTRFTHFDMPAEVMAPDGSTTRYAYDPELRLTSVTNPQGESWLYEYDAAGRLATETDYNGRTLTYVYDTAGQLVEQVNGAGQRVAYDYDVLGNVVTEEAGEQTTTLAYDPLGRLLRATSPGVDLAIERDPLGRVLSEAVNGRSVTKTYDALGRPMRRTTPAGVETEWSYGAGIAPERMTVAGQEIAFEHDEAGRETRRTSGDVVLEQTWDLLGQPLAQRLERNDAASPADVLQERTYAYESAGRLIGVEDKLTGARRFELDLADRITSVALDDSVSETYSYDPLGNITRSATGGGDAERRDYEGTLLTRAGRNRYAYDAQGRLVRQTRTRLSEKPDTWLYEWDANDRLTAVRTPDGTRWTYLYDALGRRVAKRRHAESGEVIEETLFAWDGIVLIEQTDRIGDTLSWVHQGYQPLAQVELTQGDVDARFYSIVTDLAGSPSELVDSGGRLHWHARRTIWGASSEESATPLRFAGQYADDETGLHYNHHRYYDPATGRYLAQDPIGLVAASNPSTYVSNPLVLADPQGLAPCGYVDILDPAERQHILDGDGPGSGGHRWPGAPGKTPYPQSWSDAQIIHNVGDIVTDPGTVWRVQTGSGGALTNAGNPAIWRAWEVRDGVQIRVAFEPATGKIRTAFPDPGAPTGAIVP
ncbi:RHS repeat-associated protein [Nocardioides albertanoniae]|uniref:RHS repeat-associated protein n=1 Tax=Nocardioides albertanoniae TaxID=1175486 RepID=A0A543A3N4_9ACTN|nr:RHS repeat-associated core domain-containing protein [Nocardioides albertanoniae]TQL67189.1 RHS repeat-associated protein [Nocardioides albertanoniae]